MNNLDMCSSQIINAKVHGGMVDLYVEQFRNGKVNTIIIPNCEIHHVNSTEKTCRASNPKLGFLTTVTNDVYLKGYAEIVPCVIEESTKSALTQERR